MWIALCAIVGAVLTFLAVIAFFAIIIGGIWLFKRHVFREIFDRPDMLTAIVVLTILSLATCAGTVGAIAGGIEGYHRTYPSSAK